MWALTNEGRAVLRGLGLAFRAADGRLRAGWRITLVLLVWFIGGAALQVVRNVSESATVGLAAQNVLVLLWAVAVVAGAARWLDRRAALADLGMVPDRAWWRDLGEGLALGLIVPALVFAATVALGWGEITGFMEWEGAPGPVALGLLAALVAVAGVAYFEEVLFRGYCIRNAAEGFHGLRLSPPAAVLTATVVAALVFALFHGAKISDPLQAAHFAAAGLYLSLPFLLTGRLGMSVGLHIAFNFGSAMVLNIEEAEVRVVSMAIDGPALWVGEAGLLETGAIVAGGLLTLAWLRLRHGTPRLRVELARPPGGSGRGERERVRS